MDALGRLLGSGASNGPLTRHGVDQREVVADLSGREGVDRVLMLEPVPERDY